MGREVDATDGEGTQGSSGVKKDRETAVLSSNGELFESGRLQISVYAVKR